MTCKLAGTVPRGPYAGQYYVVRGDSPFPHWIEVYLIDSNGHDALREVPERDLEKK